MDEQERNEWYKLQPRGEDEDDPVGDIKMLLTFDAEQQQLSITGASLSLAHSRSLARETSTDSRALLVIECRNLAIKDPNGALMQRRSMTRWFLAALALTRRACAGFSDPFVRLIIGSQKKKTKVVKKNLNPYFNESFSLYVPRCCWCLVFDVRLS